MKKFVLLFFVLVTIFLSSCGSYVPSRCENCGASLEDGWEECIICGGFVCYDCFDFGRDIYLETYYADYLDDHPFALEYYLDSHGYSLVKNH